MIKTDVRVIAASNKNLEKEIEEGRFRRDLFYRLNVYPIGLPSLRERGEDTDQLVAYFIERFQQKSGSGWRDFGPRAAHSEKLSLAGQRAGVGKLHGAGRDRRRGAPITEKDLPEAIRAYASPDQISSVELSIPMTMKRSNG